MWSENEADVEPCYAERFARCFCRKCKRAYQAKREARCLREVFRLARKARRYIYTGNINCGVDVTPELLKRALTEFGKTIRPLASWRYYLELNPSDLDRVHLHLALISDLPITANTIKEFWHTALGDLYVPGKPSCWFEPVKSLKGASKYLTGDTQAKRRMPLISKSVGLDSRGGSRGFFGQSIDVLYKELSRYDHAKALRNSDPYILDHPTWEYFYELAAREHAEQSRPIDDPFILDRFAAPAPDNKPVESVAKPATPFNAVASPAATMYYSPYNASFDAEVPSSCTVSAGSSGDSTDAMTPNVPQSGVYNTEDGS